MFGRKAKRIEQLEYELGKQALIAKTYASRFQSVRIALNAEREIYASSIRKINIADLQKVFDALIRYRELIVENHLPDPYQFELMLLFKKYGLNFQPVNKMNSPV